MTTDTPDALFQRIRFRGHPAANPESIVISGDARFTLLTPRLLRLEWSQAGRFEDRATYAFPTRYAPAPPFTTRVEAGVLHIDTGALALRYRQGSGRFGPHNLSIAFELNGTPHTWTPGTPNPLNLRGTRRTLDACEGDAALEEGLLSRAGWTLFDDSRAVVFTDDGWVTPRSDPTVQDWAFFGYGHDYKAALREYAHFGGQTPLVPRFVLGAWWSRYWAYSAQDLCQVVRDFAAHDLPLDVLVIDMDWHTPHSWTGYTWNRELFPDPPAFLDWVHAQGLRATLNLHPAEGIQAFEDVYPRFAAAMGIDPTSGATIPFHISDPRFVEPYFHLIHHPMEDEGVDFWWMDWQQGEASEMPGLDPLPWINHLHFSDSTRRGQRGMLYSRWGGLGNHRYPIGFSGDTIAVWTALQFQPYFTATAANVCFSWWSHDIGGHMGGATEPELYARWVQFGALNPVLRLHSTKDPRAERRPWAYPPDVAQAAKDAFHWRYRLIPYVYTMARVAHDTNLALCRPMYYEHPEEDAAYAARYQYYFGDQMIAVPIVHPAHPATGLAATDVWVPAGTWIDYQTKESFSGPRWVRLVGDLNRLPMLVKAGAILPLAVPAACGPTDALPNDRLELAVFPGAGAFRLYEDDGRTEAYRAGQYEWTEITTQSEGDVWTVRVAPVEGQCDALPAQRQLDVRLEGSRRPQWVTVDGAANNAWSYDPDTLTTTVRVPLRDKREPLTITAAAEGGISALNAAHNEAVVLGDVRRLLGARFPAHAQTPPALLDAVLELDAPGRADAVARLGGPFVRVIEFVTPEEAGQQLGRVIVGAPATGAPFDVQVAFTLRRDGTQTRHVVRVAGATGAQIIDTPFAFDGRAVAAAWEATVDVTFRGRALHTVYRSQPLFPTITTWHARIDAEDAVTVYTQNVERMPNLLHPYIVDLDAAFGARPAAVARLSATVVSATAHEVVLLFRADTPVAFTLNGEPVEAASIVGDVAPPFVNHPFHGLAQRTPVVHLRAGENHIVAQVRAPEQSAHARWRFGAALVTPEEGGTIL
ncbi:MAG: DUF5110 domain-containing protein [Anaerolineae bacterium]|nr:DUF5110 domain-containing protein [Anaerolineae bacterium]